MPSSDRMGIAGAQCPSKVIQRKKRQPLPSRDILQSTWQHEEEAESSAARSPQTHRGGGAWAVGAWVWRVCCCLSSPPCRGESKPLLADPALGLGKRATSSS